MLAESSVPSEKELVLLQRLKDAAEDMSEDGNIKGNYLSRLEKLTMSPLFKGLPSPLYLHSLRTASFLADVGLRGDILLSALVHHCRKDDLEREGFDHEGSTAGYVEALRDAMREFECVWKDTLPTQKTPDITRFNRFRSLLQGYLDQLEFRPALILTASRLDIVRHGVFPGLDMERSVLLDELFWIFSPVLHLVNSNRLVTEIESLFFREKVRPEFEEIMGEYPDHREMMTLVDDFSQDLEARLATQDVPISFIAYRAKSPFSVYRSMQRGEIWPPHDIIGFRIVVENEEDCYRVMNSIVSKWTPTHGIKDYICRPKAPFGYQAIHVA